MTFAPSEIVFFFGAGASAPFGIPTMKKMVIDFENELRKEGTDKEKEVYRDVKETLEAVYGKDVDLEAVFTVIDGIIDYNVERLGTLSIYASAASLKKALTYVAPSTEKKSTCRNLRTRFQSFVREKCVIPNDSYGIIAEVYKDFFNRLWVEATSKSSPPCASKGNYKYCQTWTMFTTNYDTCLEYYWRQVVKAGLNTGFTYLRNRDAKVLKAGMFYDAHRPSDEMRLLKLHGSVSWRVEVDGAVVEIASLGPSLVGRKYVGELMIYPIAQKELYLDPYISMFVQLNRELRKRAIWIIIGYSFNDPTIREIFSRNSNETKRIILLHPDAKQVREEKLRNVKCKEMFVLPEKFGEGDFRWVNWALTKKLRPNPEFSPRDVV